VKIFRKYFLIKIFFKNIIYHNTKYACAVNIYLFLFSPLFLKTEKKRKGYKIISVVTFFLYLKNYILYLFIVYINIDYILYINQEIINSINKKN
jgi:hypothetical protein